MDKYLTVETSDGLFKFKSPDDVIIQKSAGGLYGLCIVRRGNNGLLKYAFEFEDKDAYEAIKEYLKHYGYGTITLKQCKHYCVRG